MDSETFKEYLINILGFWPLDSDNRYTKNTPSLSIIYLIVELRDTGEVVVMERTEKTVMDVLKYYDKVVETLSLNSPHLCDTIKSIYERYQDT